MFNIYIAFNKKENVPSYLFYPTHAMPETKKERCYSNSWYLSIRLLISSSPQNFNPSYLYPLLVLGLLIPFGLNVVHFISNMTLDPLNNDSGDPNKQSCFIYNRMDPTYIYRKSKIRLPKRLYY